MKRLAHVLKYLVENQINIESISYDNEKDTTLIIYNNANNLIELTDKDFIYYSGKIVKRFSSIRTEEIIKFLNNSL